MYIRNLFCFAILVLGLANAASASYPVTPYANFPVPAAGAYAIVGSALPDGRTLLWNGGAVFVETALNSGQFSMIAQGYAGDPGFAATAPDGFHVLLGAGFLGDLYWFDTAVPADFTPASVLGSLSHYSGVFLSPSLVLVDLTKSDFSGSELDIIDISGAKAAPITVVTKPGLGAEAKDLIIDKPPYSYAATLALDEAAGLVYAMDANTRELRSFSVAALIAAYSGGTTLDWSTDGTLLGAAGVYYTGGVAGIAPDGRLILSGSEGWGLPGGIQLVDPVSGAVTEVLDPAGNQGFYSAIYNPVTGVITAMVNGEAYAIDLVGCGEGGCPDDPGCRLQTLYRVGGDLCLQLPGSIHTAVNIQWFKDGAPLNNDARTSGVHGRYLNRILLTQDDAGVYSCTYEDGSKALVSYVAGYVNMAEQVPVAGLGGLALTIAACGLAGIAAIRRRK